MIAGPARPCRADGQGAAGRRHRGGDTVAGVMADDAEFMGFALEEARRAMAAGEVPVGAVVVLGDQVIGRGHNRPIAAMDPTAHAEILALREAALGRQNYRLPGAVLYATVEPCAMCCGAALHARLARVVYGAPDPRGGAARTLYRLLDDARMNHQASVTGGVRSAECAALLGEFFRARRSAGGRETPGGAVSMETRRPS
jgi:tRNA(adenine34) deaminase